MLRGFPRQCRVALLGDCFVGASGQRWANVCLPGQRLRCCSGFLGLVVELGLRRSASLLSRLRGDTSLFDRTAGGIWHAIFSCDDNVASDVEGRSGCLDASCPMR